MTRLRVFQLRLLASAALLLLVFGIVRLLWYPGAHFAISGAYKQFLVLAGVVIVIGPVLSALVYKPGKKGLVFDLAVLTGVELLAVVAATTLLFLRQPHFAVFAVDRFEAVAYGEADLSSLPSGIDIRRPGHAPRLIHARMPEDPATVSRLIDETVLMGMADIDRRSEFWEPYPSGIPTIKAAARPLADLLEGSEQQRRAASDWLESGSKEVSDYIFLPLRGRASDAVIVLDADVGYPVATLVADPW
ncbi:MAG: hypothetical protein QNJ23_11850 [Woeseiaceae bacterium]|nr:hypothetical protein [Woeseiaceae bacterium]